MEDNYSSCAHLSRAPLKSQRLRNPFLVKIDSSSLSVNNYVEGIKLNIVCECSFWIFSFWGVNINSFHQKLSLDWTEIKNQLLDNKFIDESALHSNDPELYKDEYNKIIHEIKGPKDFNLNFSGPNKRDTYPLVVMLILNDNEKQDMIDINDIVLLISIIHLKDNLVPLDTSIIAQYIKRKSGIVLNLQDLYVSTDYGDQNSPYCIICQENYINRALLPCKHACVCAVCFEKIDSCPLCRSLIQNFILINQPQQETIENSNENPSNNNNKRWFHSIINFFKSG